MLFLVLFLICMQVAYGCPTECYCIGTYRVSVYCDSRNLNYIPKFIPELTTQLFFNGNQFTKVVPGMLQGQIRGNEQDWTNEKVPLKHLQVIRLDMNPIEIVNENIFKDLPSLQVIYLPYGAKIQREVLGQLKLDKETFDGFLRVPTHPLEDPNFFAYSKFNVTYG